MTRSLTIAMLMASACGTAAAKIAGNRPYVAVFEKRSPLYARCLPAGNEGSEGTTQILRLRPEGDVVIETHAWFNRNGIVLGWSPRQGKVAVMRLRQDEGLSRERQIEFSFYLGDQFLRSYTTADLVLLGARVERDLDAIERGLGMHSERAVYRVDGCKQAWNTNDHYFSVTLEDARTLAFDVLTGRLCRVEQQESRQQLVPAEGSERLGSREDAQPGAEEAHSEERALLPWPDGRALRGFMTGLKLVSLPPEWARYIVGRATTGAAPARKPQITRPLQAIKSHASSGVPLRVLQSVQVAAGAGLPTPGHVGVDDGGLHAGMPERLLDLPDVGPEPPQMGGKRVPEGVRNLKKPPDPPDQTRKVA